jgi:hypothetical protein
MPEQDNQKLADDLVKSLGLQQPPLAIRFSQESLPGIEPYAEMTCAIPGARLAEVVQQIKTTTVIDGTVANYASEDSRRFDMS